MNKNEYIKKYFADLSTLITKIDTEILERIASLIEVSRDQGGVIYVFGNGGSASTASHMVCDMGKNTRNNIVPNIKIICLNDNTPIFSAYANDEGYQNVFAEQIKSMGCKDDLAIAISGSGNSRNVLLGIRIAKSIGMQTVGITGYDGGELIKLVDMALCVPSDDMEQIEDIHLIINHILTGLLRGTRYQAIKKSI